MNPTKRIRIQDIADRANVSTGTVDRVLHNREEVSEKTRKKIMEIIEELNYRPNLLAQRLASDKIYKLAILIPKYSKNNVYWKGPLEGIQKAMKEIGKYGVVLESFFFDLKDENSFRKESLNTLFSNPDGILIAPTFEHETREFAKKCDQKKIPYVFIDSYLSGENNLSYFGQDSFQSGYLAGKLIYYNLKKHSEILVLNFASALKNYPHFREREKGIKQFLQDHSFKGKVTTLNIAPDQEKNLDHLLADILHHKTRGLFTTSSAHKVAKYIEAIGKGRLMIVGYDLTKANREYLEKDIIDFLICQKPVAQGYQGIMALFDYLILKKTIQKTSYMPLEVITKENAGYYMDLSK